jgi:hypothetical protein
MGRHHHHYEELKTRHQVAHYGHVSIPASGPIDRSRFAAELQNKPGLMQAFCGRIQKEVGGQGHQACVAFAESVMNRAAARGLSLEQAIRGHYYPKHQHNPGWSNNRGFTAAVNEALAGTNITHGATGNGSNWSHGRITARIGGEKFGIEAAELHGSGRHHHGKNYAGLRHHRDQTHHAAPHKNGRHHPQPQRHVRHHAV